MTRQENGMPQWFAVACVYLGAAIQGFTLVSFAASGPELRQIHHLTDAQYGLIFLPQLGATICGAIAGAVLASRVGMQRLLWIALLFNGLSQVLLRVVPTVAHAQAMPVLLAATAALGAGFGLMGVPMNGYPTLFFPHRNAAATVGIHCFNGSGLIFGPLLLQFALTHAGFSLYPEMQAAAAFGLAAVVFLGRFHVQESEAASGNATQAPPWQSPTFWALAAIATIYALAEGTFSNWASVYLRDGRHFSAGVAAIGLSAFWSGVVAGRLAVTLLVLKFSERVIWRLLLIVMIVISLLLPQATSPISAIAMFALAGIGCSAVFPLTVTFATKRFSQHLAWASSLMIAALMTGNGLGSFLLGMLHEHVSFENLFRLAAIYPAAALLLTFLVRKPTSDQIPKR
jgi:fucose permease